MCYGKKPEKMEAYKAYIRLVVETIIRLNPQLRLDDGDGEPNFLLGMAYPTSWSIRDKDEYRRFFNDSVAGLGVCFDWIISESDSVYYSIPPTENEVYGSIYDGVSVAIHYGVSTMDFTVMDQGRKISNEGWSNGLGAGIIEQDILNSYRENDYEGFARAYSENQRLLAETDNHHINLEDWLIYKCRKAKEEAYIELVDNILLDFHLFKLTGDPSFRIHRFEYEFSMSEVTERYRCAVNQHLEHLRERVKEITGKEVDMVILGGAPVFMQWFGLMIRSIFPIARIYYAIPSYVVARGVALYGASLMKASKTAGI